jgi:C-terminal processing protease CtpA/Prc
VLASIDTQIAKADEVIAINGVPVPEIVKRLWPYLRADGSSDEKRLRQIGHDRLDTSQLDLIWPLLSPPQQGQWQISIKRNDELKTVSVAAVTLNTRNAELNKQGYKPKSSDWSLSINGPTAVMRLPNFAYYNNRFDWSTWLKDSFAELKAKNVENLVVDIRDLEGGNDRITTDVLAYLIQSPFRFIADQAVTTYERVPYSLVRYLDTWNYDFFDRTGQVDRITSGPQQGLYSVKSRMLGVRTIEPAAGAFKGRVVMLISGENSSAGFNLTFLAQQAGAAKLIGQTTGGNQRGLNSSQLTWLTLPNSGVSVDIPLLAHTYTAETPDRSVTPDIAVVRTFNGLRSGIDEEMAVALKFFVR